MRSPRNLRGPVRFGNAADGRTGVATVREPPGPSDPSEATEFVRSVVICAGLGAILWTGACWTLLHALHGSLSGRPR